MDSNYSKAISGLEDLLKRLDEEGCLWEIYEMQGFQGLTYALKSVKKEVYMEVWSYLKENRKQLKFYMTVPKDI